MDIQSLKSAVVFIMMTGALDSHLAYAALDQAFASPFDLTGFKFLKLEYGSKVSQKFLAQIGEVSHGGGDAYFVKDGKIVASFKDFKNPDRTRLLREKLALVLRPLAS